MPLSYDPDDIGRGPIGAWPGFFVYEPLHPDVIKAKYNKLNSKLVGSSGHSLSIIKKDTVTIDTENYEALRCQLAISGTGELYRVEVIAKAALRNVYSKSKVELVAGTDNILEIPAEHIFNETDAQKYASQEARKIKFGDFVYSWSSKDDIEVGSFVALNIADPLINTTVFVTGKRKNRERPLYHYYGIGTSEFSLETVLRKGDTYFTPSQLGFFTDKSIRGNVVTVSASDYYYPANRRCDGTADEVQINAAITKLSSESGGGVVRLSPGTFTIAASITLSDKVILEGAGDKTTVSFSTDIKPIDMSTAVDAKVRDLTVEFTGSTEVEQYAIDGSGDRCVVANNNINHPGCLGVRVAGNGCGVVGNKLTGGKDSINIDPKTAAEFSNNNNVGDVSVAWLDSTYFVIAYVDTTDSNKGKAIIGEIDSSYNITYGTASTFNNASTANISVKALDSTHFVVSYRDGGNSNYGTAIIGETDGDTAIDGWGSENVFNSAASYSTCVDVLDSTHFVVSYRDGGNGGAGTAIIGVTDGDITISSYGSASVFNSNSSYTKCAVLDSTHFVVAHEDNDNSGYGTAIVGQTDGSTSIDSYGSESVFNAAATEHIDVTVLDSTHFIVAYRDDGNSNYGTLVIGVSSGTTISEYSSEKIFNLAESNYMSITKINNNTFSILYSDNDNSDAITVIIGKWFGINSIFLSEEYVAYDSASSIVDCDGNIITFVGAGTDGYAQYIDYTVPNSFCIKSTGNNNLITQNQIYGTDGKFIEVGIDVEGALNDVSNNQIYGEHSDGVDKHILYGINIRDYSSRCNVATNNIKEVDEVAVVNQGTGTKITNIMAEDNGNLIDRGNCESTTAPMVQDETTPDNTNVGTYARDTDEYEGTYGWKATGAGGGTMTVRLVDSSSDNHGLVPGLTYELTAYVKSSGYTVSNVKLFYDDDQTSAVYSTAKTADAYELLTLEFTVDADSTDLDFGIFVDETGTDYIIWDTIRLKPVGINNEHDQQFVDNGTGTQTGQNSWQDYSGV
jgi:hypothetical protein